MTRARELEALELQTHTSRALSLRDLSQMPFHYLEPLHKVREAHVWN